MENSELLDADEVQFWPIVPTAARSLRPGDEILVPSTDGGLWPQEACHGRITDIRDDEATGYITINGELVRGASGLFEKPANPGEVFQRLLQPGDAPRGTESILVRAEHLWKWIGVQMDDPNGGPEKYILRRFRRAHHEETDGEVVEVLLQAVWNSNKTITATLLPNATIGFKGHR